MEEGLLKYLFEYIKGMSISNCDVYLNRPSILGDKETRHKSYIVVSLPNGIEDMSAFSNATGIITIGSKDKIIGLPNVAEITRISALLKARFPILTDNYSLLDFAFTSDDSEGTGWHEYYYTFQIYINN